jgi:hypothetical protein
MSSFYDDASLVVIPSGYKTSKIYAEKPTDGSGDLTFTRASDATRVASNGLIEKVRTNLILQSETFSNNTDWPKLNSATITANTSVAPDGTTTADTLTLTTNASSSIYQSITTVSELTFSVYAKVASGTKNFRLRFDRPSAIESADFTATTTWQRFTFTATTTGSGVVYIINDSTGTAGDLIIWGAQLETGDIATDYIPTTTAAVSVGPVSGLPRLDYLGSSCPRLLLEPQRTNSALFSEQLNNAAWIKQSATISANSSVSPDGYSNADKVAIDNGVSGGYVYQSIATTSSTVYTTSFFVKAAGINFTKFYSNVTGSYVTAVINLTTGAITNSDFATTPTATNYGNGWWRVSYTETSGGGSIPIYVDGGSTSNGGGITGNGTDGILIWGAQLEEGAYATSYIPTLAASVTRVADAASKTGISSLIGQTEGVVFVDFTLNGLVNFGTPISVNNGTDTRYIWFTIFANGTLRAELYDGAVQSSISFTGAVVGGRYKMAFGYKTNDFALYVNGALVGTDLVGTTFSGTTLSRVDFDLTNPSVYSTASESINQALLFKTRLTNAQMQELTSL